jgi:hypothetical protein
MNARLLRLAVNKEHIVEALTADVHFRQAGFQAL